MNKVIVVVSAAVVCSVLYVGAASAEMAAFNKAIDHFVTAEVATKTQGYAIGVIVDGRVVSMHTGGLREAGRDDVIDIDTVFRLASVSKTFAPAIVAARGELDYSESVSANLPSLRLSSKAYLRDLNLGHILSQSSGLFPHAYTNLIQENVAYERIIKQLDSVSFVCAPGACYGYQNVIYSLAGDIMAAKLDEPYEVLVTKSLFKPLGMVRSSLGRKDFLAEKNRASPHRWNKNAHAWDILAVEENYYRIAPAAGVNSSLRDMMVWLQAQLGQYPLVLGRAALTEMHSPQVRTSRKLAHYKQAMWDGVSNMGYAYGWRTFDFAPRLDFIPPNAGSIIVDGEAVVANGMSAQGRTYAMTGFVHHGGWVKGVRTEVVFNPALNMGMVYLSNAETNVASKIVPSVLRLYALHIVSKE